MNGGQGWRRENIDQNVSSWNAMVQLLHDSNTNPISHNSDITTTSANVATSTVRFLRHFLFAVQSKNVPPWARRADRKCLDRAPKLPWEKREEVKKSRALCWG
jgi:hypothetical protein